MFPVLELAFKALTEVVHPCARICANVKHIECNHDFVEAEGRSAVDSKNMGRRLVKDPHSCPPEAEEPVRVLLPFSTPTVFVAHRSSIGHPFPLNSGQTENHNHRLRMSLNINDTCVFGVF